MLVASLVNDFLAERAHLGRETLEHYEWELGRLVTYCEDKGAVEAQDVTLPVLVGFMTWLRETPTTRGTLRIPGSLVSYHKRVKAFLRWAVDAEELKPRVLKLPAPHRQQAIPATLSHDDAVKLLRAAGDGEGPALAARNSGIVLLLLSTGLRASELCGLSVQDVNLDGEGYVLIRHGKNDKMRVVGPLGQRTVRALRTYLRFRPGQKKGATAFFLSRVGGPLNRDTLWQVFRRLGRRTGIASHPHSWRHTWARSQAEAGAPVIAISRLMGHSNIQTTSLYLGQFNSQDAMKMVHSPVDSL